MSLHLSCVGAYSPHAPDARAGKCARTVVCVGGCCGVGNASETACAQGDYDVRPARLPVRPISMRSHRSAIRPWRRCESYGDDFPSVGGVGRQVRVQAVGVWKAVVRQPLRQRGGVLGGQPMKRRPPRGALVDERGPPSGRECRPRSRTPTRVRQGSSSAHREAVQGPLRPTGTCGTHHEAMSKRPLLRNVVDGVRRRLHIDEKPPRHARKSVTRQNFLFLNVHRCVGPPDRRPRQPPRRRKHPKNHG